MGIGVWGLGMGIWGGGIGPPPTPQSPIPNPQSPIPKEKLKNIFNMKFKIIILSFFPINLIFCLSISLNLMKKL